MLRARAGGERVGTAAFCYNCTGRMPDSGRSVGPLGPTVARRRPSVTQPMNSARSLLLSSFVLLGMCGCDAELEPIAGTRAEAEGSSDAGQGGAGAAAHAGDGGRAGQSIVLPPNVEQGWTFDASTEGWSILETSPEDVLGSSSSVWSLAEGHPNAGAVRLDVPFNGTEQQVAYGLRFDPPRDLTGRVLAVWLLLASGFNVSPNQPGGAQVYAFSGDDWIWANGPWFMLRNEGEWIQGVLDVDAPQIEYAGFDPTDIREIGVMIGTGNVGEHVGATVYFDTFEVRSW